MHIAQGLCHQAQRLALAAQHEDVAQRGCSPRHKIGNGVRHQRRFLSPQHLFGFVARRGQAVTPFLNLVGRLTLFQPRRPRHHRQGENSRSAVGRHFGGVGAKAAELACMLCFRKHGVQQLQNLGRIASRVVARQHGAAHGLANEAARRFKDPRLGATKAVDALLGVTDDEDGRGALATGPATGTGIGRQPGVQRMPLQGAGVLKLIDQHMADACVQPLLHPTRQRGVAQQGQGTAFQIGHVGQASGTLVRREFGQQDA